MIIKQFVKPNVIYGKLHSGGSILPLSGGAWFESKIGEDTYLRSYKDKNTVCFEKNNPKKGKIKPLKAAPPKKINYIL